MDTINNYTWQFDAASIVLRYLFLAGSTYVVFYVYQKKRFARLKIQKEVPAPGIIQQEILFSSFTLLTYCGTSWLVFQWENAGITKIYRDLHTHSYYYFVLSVAAMVIIHDAYFYWTHRLLHLPRLFRWVHKTHHLSHNPTPWASFSFHPLEALVSAGIIPLIVFLIPCHPFALFSFLTFMTLINVMGHLGYETFPKRITNGKIWKWQNTSTNHNLHHQHSRYNFGLYFTVWDRLMNTYSFPDSPRR
jgi:sterol desaturase/sphingolipid hydroxylase (fatty acid hydroxylase superfamily)